MTLIINARAMHEESACAASAQDHPESTSERRVSSFCDFEIL